MLTTPNGPMYWTIKRLLSYPMIPLNSGFFGNSRAIPTASHSESISVHIHLDASFLVAVLRKWLIPVTSSINAMAKAPIPNPWYIDR